MDRNRIRRWATRKKDWVNRLPVLISLGLFFALPILPREVEELSTLDFKGWKKWGLVEENTGSSKTKLRISENLPKHFELFFDFEGDVSEPNQSSAKLFPLRSMSILNSSYIRDQKISFYGKQSAYFAGKQNQIQISVAGNPIFGPKPEPFTITLPIMIQDLGGEHIVLERTVYIRGRRIGFSLEIVNGKPVFNAYHLVKMGDEKKISFEVESKIRLRRKVWEVISLYFNPLEQTFVMYVNGKEVGEWGNTAPDGIGFSFMEEDNTPLTIAKSFFGNLDGVHIHKGLPLIQYPKYEAVEYDMDTKTAKQEGSYAISPVYDTKYSQSTLSEVKLGVMKQNEEGFEIYFRGRNSKFKEEDENLRWIRISESSKNLPSNRFRYHQWKVWLRPDPSGKSAPSLSSLQTRIKLQLPPVTPTHFTLSPSQESLCFFWMGNHEKEVQEGGGYQIHYGLLPNQMIGTLFAKPNGISLEPISGSEETSSKKSKKFCVNEETLRQNIYIPEGDTLEKIEPLGEEIAYSRKEKRGHLFQKGFTYYFRISAYNKFANDWDAKDQRSPLSEPISYTFPKEVTNARLP